MRRAGLLFSLSVLLATPAAAETARAGPYQVTLMLPPSGLYAGEEMEIEFHVERLDGDPGKGPAPLTWARIRGVVDMPSMPAMPRFDELAHREGIPGVYGVHPVFPHGGDYRLCLTILPPEIQPVGDPRPTEAFDFEFPLVVYDATSSPTRESAKVRPFLLDVIATPRHPVAGEPVELELRVRLANSFELREVTDFDVQHEKLMHLFIVSQDLAEFAHEHPAAGGAGALPAHVPLSARGALPDLRGRRTEGRRVADPFVADRGRRGPRRRSRPPRPSAARTRAARSDDAGGRACRGGARSS